jgi:hypothetical protein
MAPWAGDSTRSLTTAIPTLRRADVARHPVRPSARVRAGYCGPTVRVGGCRTVTGFAVDAALACSVLTALRLVGMALRRPTEDRPSGIQPRPRTVPATAATKTPGGTVTTSASSPVPCAPTVSVARGRGVLRARPGPRGPRDRAARGVRSVAAAAFSSLKRGPRSRRELLTSPTTSAPPASAGVHWPPRPRAGTIAGWRVWSPSSVLP